MPKMKTHRGAAKRFKITGRGKLMHARTFRGHYLEKKSSRRIRRLTGNVEVDKSDLKSARRLLGK